MTEPIQLKPMTVGSREWREHNWQLIVHYAGMALQGILASQGSNVDTKGTAARAVELAEALVSELDRRRNM